MFEDLAAENSGGAILHAYVYGFSGKVTNISDPPGS
jgi:hypothetical protein